MRGGVEEKEMRVITIETLERHEEHKSFTVQEIERTSMQCHGNLDFTLHFASLEVRVVFSNPSKTGSE